MRLCWKDLFWLTATSFLLPPTIACAQPAIGNDRGASDEERSVAALPIAPEARSRQRAGPVGGPLNTGGLEIDPGIYAPTDFHITSFDTTSVGLRWLHLDGPRTKVSRSVNGGPWTVVQSFGPLPPGSYVDYHDPASASSAENCYRVSVSDGVNSFSAKTSPIRCVITPDGRKVDVYRAQLRLTMGNTADAGTDDAVQIRLQSPTSLVTSQPSWVPAGNGTWLDSFADDFERGSDRTYELLIDNVAQLSDITMITIAKPGGDTMCVRRVELLIDGQHSFAKTFGLVPNSCAQVGANGVLSIPFDELHAQASWNQTVTAVTPGIPAEHLRALIVAQFGDKLHGRGSLRNGGALTTTVKSGRRLAVSLPIEIHNVFLLGDVDSTIHFDLVLRHDDLGDHMSIENVDADSSDLLELLSPILVSKILWETSQAIEGIVRQSRAVDIPNPLVGTVACFKPDGGVTYMFPNVCH